MSIPLIQAALTALAGMGLAAIFSSDDDEAERENAPAALPDDPASIVVPSPPPALPESVLPSAQEPTVFQSVPVERPEGTRMEQVAELYEMGLKQRDIADRLGIGLGTVNRELQHAREQGIIV